MSLPIDLLTAAGYSGLFATDSQAKLIILSILDSVVSIDDNGAMDSRTGRRACAEATTGAAGARDLKVTIVC